MARPSLMVDPYPDAEHPLPKPILFGAVALAIATILIIAGARDTGVGVSSTAESRRIASRDLSFADAPDGSLAVTDAGEHRIIARVAPETGGFIRAALRGLDRNRLRHSDPEDAPFRLTLDTTNHLWLQDLATGQRIDLRAFGPTNAEAFAAFLTAGAAS